MKRLVNSIRNIQHPFQFWSEYYKRKEKPETDSFNIVLEGGLKVEIPNDLISAFDEVFLREVYQANTRLSVDAPLIIDIGANVGYFSLYAFKNFKNPKVIAFEPFPANFKLLEKHKEVNSLDSLILDKRAISGTESLLKINYNPNEDYSVGASVVVSKPGVSSSLEVEAISLKALFDQYEVARCDLLKVDCEGAEYNILFNTPDEVYNSIDKIVIEMHEWVPKEEGTPDQLISFLEAKGFKVDFKSNWMLWAVRD